MSFESLNDIKYVPLPRFSTGIDEMDWLFFGEYADWGFPNSKLTLFYGPSGCGKSRALIEMCRNVSRTGRTVLYIQGESSLSDLRSWVGEDGERIPDTFKVSEETSLEQQIIDIRNSGAHLVINDSINKIDEYCNSATQVNRIIDGYKDLVKETKSHVIFVCQQNKDGSPKGPSDLSHMVDIVLHADFMYNGRVKIKNHFRIEVGWKHRCGRTGEEYFSVWRHTDKKAECVSNNRMYDFRWCDHNGLDLLTMEVPIGCLPNKLFDVHSCTFMFEVDPKYYNEMRKRNLKVV